MSIENLIVVVVVIVSAFGRIAYDFFIKNDRKQDHEINEQEKKFNKDLKELKEEMSKGFEEIKSSLSVIKEFMIKQNFKNDILDKLQLKVEKLEDDVRYLQQIVRNIESSWKMQHKKNDS